MEYNEQVGGWNRGLHKPIEETLRNSYEVDSETGCWNWTKALYRNGYGAVYDWEREKPRVAHRVAARIWLGFEDNDRHVMVLHRCDNRRCINPEHLYFGTGRDNARDRRERNPQNGERNRSAKLTAIQVRCIRACVAVGATHGDIARWFGVTRENISAIAQGKTWKLEIYPGQDGKPGFTTYSLRAER